MIPSPTSTPRIRDAVDADLPALGRLFVQVNDLHVAARPDVFRSPATGEQVETYLGIRLEEAGCRLFVADVGERTVGFLLARLRAAPMVPIYRRRQEIEIEIVVVAHDSQGLGVGRALMERAHRWAADSGVERLRLTVYEFNQGARDFYERLGYATEQRIMSRPVGSLPRSGAAR